MQQKQDSNDELGNPKSDKILTWAVVLALVALATIGILSSWGCSEKSAPPDGNMMGKDKKVQTVETEVSKECCPTKKPLTLETLEADLKEVNDAIAELQKEDGRINKKVDEVVGNVTTLTNSVNELADKVKDLDVNKADKTELGKFASRRRVSRLEVNLKAHITSDLAKPAAPEPATTTPPPPVEAPTRPPGTVTIRAVRVPRR